MEYKTKRIRNKKGRKTGIYRITCLVTNSVYIGSSTDIHDRLTEYKQPALSGATTGIKESILTHGIDNHEIKILIIFESDISKKELYTYEDAFILLYLERLGEDKMLNSHCNEKKKWMSEKTLQHVKFNNGTYGIPSKDHNQAKRVNQYTMDGVFIKTWDCIRDVDKFFGKKSNMAAACKGRIKSCLGFKWSYAD